MKHLLGGLIAVSALGIAGAAGLPVLKPEPRQAEAAHFTAQLLGHAHYLPTALDDARSEDIFERYLKALDPERLFLLQSDVDGWRYARTRLDDAILNRDLDLPFALYQRYAERAEAAFGQALAQIHTGFDFTQDEHHRLRRNDAPWAGSEAERAEVWRKRLKHEWLQLRLAGQPEARIATTLEHRYLAAQRRLQRTRSEDVFQLFMGAYTGSVDPHTRYLGPRAAREFDISMRVSLVGIGALLEEKDDFATIRGITPGGPAARSGHLHVGDRIVGVGQGDKGAIEDVQGWRLDDVVAKVRGAAGSVVRLDVRPGNSGADASHRTVALVRRKVELEDQAARKMIVNVSGSPRRIGIITLPAFYQDFEARARGEQSFRSAARDVARLLGELRTEGVDGVVIDLRDNGGGSLDEAIELTGLFIETGPVVQQRDARGRVQVRGDSDPAVAWRGPLAVLIDRHSASASEIFAAAIQDYRRGLVLGETSYGKGTVQSLVSLEKLSPTPLKGLGDLTFTIAQFFRINGATTQLRGVKPDLALPMLPDGDQAGEAGFDNALPFQRIRAANYDTLAELDDSLPRLTALHEARIAANPAFGRLLADIALTRARQARNEVSLEEATRRAEDTPPPPRPEHPPGPDLLQVEAAHIVADRIELSPSNAQTRP